MASSAWLSSRIQSSSFSVLPSIGIVSRQLRPIIPQPPLHLKTRKLIFEKCQNFSSSEATLISCCCSSHRTNSLTGLVEKEIARNQNDDADKVIGTEEEVVYKFSASWIDLYLPKVVRPYAQLARFHKLSPTWLFAWPCFWSITLASPSSKLLSIKMFVLFGLGSFFLRSVSCVINDILDRDIDAKVERTKSRPLASGLLIPYHGLNFLGFLVLLYLGFLLQLNNYRAPKFHLNFYHGIRASMHFHFYHSRVLGLLLLPLIFSYPLMKRLTFWPQAYLGVAFNWGALLGWAAIEGSLNYAISLPLYVSGLFWTLVYDTIYAHQDKEDDLRVGVKSTAILFGEQTKIWITGFGIASIITLILSGYNATIGWPFYVSLIAASAQLAWQIWTADLSNPADCSNKFLSNTWYGAIMFGGILFGRLVT